MVSGRAPSWSPAPRAGPAVTPLSRRFRCTYQWFGWARTDLNPVNWSMSPSEGHVALNFCPERVRSWCSSRQPNRDMSKSRGPRMTKPGQDWADCWLSATACSLFHHLIGSRPEHSQRPDSIGRSSRIKRAFPPGTRGRSQFCDRGNVLAGSPSGIHASEAVRRCAATAQLGLTGTHRVPPVCHPAWPCCSGLTARLREASPPSVGRPRFRLAGGSGSSGSIPWRPQGDQPPPPRFGQPRGERLPVALTGRSCVSYIDPWYSMNYHIALPRLGVSFHCGHYLLTAQVWQRRPAWGYGRWLRAARVAAKPWLQWPSRRPLVETMSCWVRSMMTPGVRRSCWMRPWSSWLGVGGKPPACR